LSDAGVGDSIVDVVGVGGEFELLDLGLSVPRETEEESGGAS